MKVDEGMGPLKPSLGYEEEKHAEGRSSATTKKEKPPH